MEEGSRNSLLPHHEKYRTNIGTREKIIGQENENANKKRLQVNDMFRNKVIISNKLKVSADFCQSTDLKSINNKTTSPVSDIKNETVVNKEMFLQKKLETNNTKVAVHVSETSVGLEPWGVNSQTFGKIAFLMF